MSDPVIHFEINVYKPRAAIRFYRRMFGWRIAAFDKRMSHASISSTGRGGIGGGIAGTNSRGVTMYVRVKNVPAALKKAKACGGRVTRKPMPIPGMGTIGWFRDPAGNEIGLWARR